MHSSDWYRHHSSRIALCARRRNREEWILEQNFQEDFLDEKKIEYQTFSFAIKCQNRLIKSFETEILIFCLPEIYSSLCHHLDCASNSAMHALPIQIRLNGSPSRITSPSASALQMAILMEQYCRSASDIFHSRPPACLGLVVCLALGACVRLHVAAAPAQPNESDWLRPRCLLYALFSPPGYVDIKSRATK